MASISDDKGGLRSLIYTNAAGERKQIKLGRLPKRDAESVRVHVESMVIAQLVGSSPPRARQNGSPAWTSLLKTL